MPGNGFTEGLSNNLTLLGVGTGAWSFNNLRGGDVEVFAKVGAGAVDEDNDARFLFAAGEGFIGATLEEVFPGLAGADHLYARSVSASANISFSFA